MSILIAYSGKQAGSDPFVEDFAAWASHSFVSGGAVTVLDLDKSQIDDTPYEIIFLVDSLREYSRDRLRVRGQPWVCLLAWTFDGLRHLPKSSAFDIGVHYIVSNCSMFVKQLGLAIPAEFSWKPLPNTLTGRHSSQFAMMEPTEEVTTVTLRHLVGTVLHSVVDRDLSLLQFTGDWLTKQGQGDRFKVFVSEDEPMRLPASLAPFLTRYKKSEAVSLYNQLQYYIPAPRIIDYRVGIVPPEILYALGAGSEILTIKHPVMEALKLFLVNAHPSLSSYRNALEGVKLASPSKPLKPSLELSDFGNDKFVASLYNAYRRSKFGAASKRS